MLFALLLLQSLCLVFQGTISKEFYDDVAFATDDSSMPDSQLTPGENIADSPQLISNYGSMEGGRQLFKKYKSADSSWQGPDQPDNLQSADSPWQGPDQPDNLQSADSPWQGFNLPHNLQSADSPWQGFNLPHILQSADSPWQNTNQPHNLLPADNTWQGFNLPHNLQSADSPWQGLDQPHNLQSVESTWQNNNLPLNLLSAHDSPWQGLDQPHNLQFQQNEGDGYEVAMNNYNWNKAGASVAEEQTGDKSGAHHRSRVFYPVKSDNLKKTYSKRARPRYGIFMRKLPTNFSIAKKNQEREDLQKMIHKLKHIGFPVDMMLSTARQKALLTPNVPFKEIVRTEMDKFVNKGDWQRRLLRMG